jgi:hypothetical protein
MQSSISEELAKTDHDRYLYFKKPQFSYVLKQCFGTRSGTGSALIMVDWIRIQEGKNDPKNIKKLRNFMFWSAGYYLLTAEGLACSLDFPYGGLGISELQLLIKTILKYVLIVFKFLVIKTLEMDPDPHWPKMLDPDPHWNQPSLYLSMGATNSIRETPDSHLCKNLVLLESGLWNQIPLSNI